MSDPFNVLFTMYMYNFQSLLKKEMNNRIHNMGKPICTYKIALILTQYMETCQICLTSGLIVLFIFLYSLSQPFLNYGMEEEWYNTRRTKLKKHWLNWFLNHLLIAFYSSFDWLKCLCNTNTSTYEGSSRMTFNEVPNEDLT